MTVTELRPVTLGGSRMAAAIGVGWDSPIRVFGELTGKPGFERDADTPMTRLGKLLQPVIFQAMQADGYSVAEYPDGLALPAREPHRWLVGHPDGCGTGDLDGLVIEAKAQAWPHADLSAEVQLLTYMHLGGYAGGLLATLHNLHLDVREVERDQNHIDLILYLAERFMDYVRRDVWPPPTGHPDDRPALADAFPDTTPGKQVRENREIREARRELLLLKSQDGKHGARTRRKAYLEGLITAHMGDADTLVSLHDEVVARWPVVSRKSFDAKRHAKECPQCHAAFTTTSMGRRFTVS